MLLKRRKARDFLLRTDRPNFLEIVYRAKVTPRQKEILYKKFLDDMSNTKIAMDLFISVETVRNELACAYDLLYSYLFTA